MANLEGGIATIKPWDDYPEAVQCPGPSACRPGAPHPAARVAAEIRKHFGEFGIEGGTIRMGVVGRALYLVLGVVVGLGIAAYLVG